MSRLRWPGLIILAAFLAVIGWLLIATTFMPYDDEGYVLLSLANFSEHGGLYDQVFTQYGPFPFLYYDLLHWLSGWPIAHTLGRATTLLHWVGSALGAGLIAWRLSGRYWTAWFTTGITFGYLWQMTSEPAHPGSLIALITAIGLAAAVEALLRSKPVLATAVLGLSGAILVLTKINIGLLWGATAGAFVLLMTGAPTVRRRGAGLALLGLGVMPFLLMRPLLGTSQVFTLACIFSAASAAVISLQASSATAIFRRRDALGGLIIFAVTGVGIILATLTHGTTLSGLINGVLLQPLQHPVNFHVGLAWQPLWSWPLLALSLSIVGLWHWRPTLRSRLTAIVAGLRLIGFGIFLFHLESWLTIRGVSQVIKLALPLAPLFLLPLAPTTPDRYRYQAIGLVTLMAMGQLLHAYPVAGSQMGWGTFLFMPLFVIGLSEAVEHFTRQRRMPWAPPLLATIALSAMGCQLYWLADTGHDRWRTSLPLNLPAAEDIRPPENIRYALRILTTNAQLHADVLYSQPGMFSFNLWSGIPTPTLKNATHWFWLLSEAEQQTIITRLSTKPRSAIISLPGLDDFLTGKLHMRITGPLIAYLQTHYRPLFGISGYQFLVPKTSSAQPFLVAENFTNQAKSGSGEPSLITVNVVAQATIARVTVRHVNHAEREFLNLDASNCRVMAEPINSVGQTTGLSQLMTWPLNLSGLYRLSLYHNGPASPALPGYQLLFFNAAGHVVLEACYSEPLSVSAPPKAD